MGGADVVTIWIDTCSDAYAESYANGEIVVPQFYEGYPVNVVYTCGMDLLADDLPAVTPSGPLWAAAGLGQTTSSVSLGLPALGIAVGLGLGLLLF